jgi:glycosyltransferase involved in cell wall biosynthesis
VKVVHVVPHIDDEAMGPSYSVPRLCQSLAACGHSVGLLCLAAKGDISGVVVHVHSQWQALNRFAVSPGLAKALRERARRVDIVHNHSLWAMPNVAVGWVVPGRHARLVTSPRGTLSPWALARSKWVKRAIWPLQRRALFRADLLHATSEEELADIRAVGLKQPVAVIPNGVDVPRQDPQLKSRPAERTLLFLSRLHPTKGIDLLLAAWQRLQDKHPDWRLVIAGRGEPAHEQSIRELAERLAVRRVTFVGPLYGAMKSGAYWGAELFVLPSHTENFGMVVAEALAHGLPAVVSNGAPWGGLVTEDCGWWIDNTQESLVRTLDEAMQCSVHQLAVKGNRGRQWMEREFRWDALGANMSEAYRWLLEGGEKPACVRFD